MELATVVEGKIKAVSQELAQNLPRNTKSPVISHTKFKILLHILYLLFCLNFSSFNAPQVISTQGPSPGILPFSPLI